MDFNTFKAKLADYVTQALNDRTVAFQGFSGKRLVCPLGCHPDLYEFPTPTAVIAARVWSVTFDEATSFIKAYDQSSETYDDIGEDLFPWYDLGKRYHKRLYR